MTTPTLLGKTTRNLSQFAEKKLVGKAHTRADRSDVSEGIPSNIQITTATIFGEEVPSSGTAIGAMSLYDVDANNRIQKIQLDVTVINGTSYNASESEEDGGGDSNQSTGPHAYSLSLPTDYVNPSGYTNSNPKKGTGPFVNGKRLFDTLGALQIVPTNLYIDPTFQTPNPYAPKIYYVDANGTTKIMGPADPIDWFVDPYSGIVFLQEYDQYKIPTKVECYIYIGDMADQTTGSGASTLNGLTDVSVSSPSNGQILAYNSSNSRWEAQTQSSGNGIERYQYIQSSGTVAAKQAIQISGLDFNGVTPTNADTKVFLNGVLQRGGTSTELANDSVDYHWFSDTQIKMVDAIVTEDVITIYHVNTSYSNGKDILLHTDDAAFDNARVITAGDGITITKPSAPNQRQLLVSNTGLIQRTKVTFTTSTTINQNTNVTVTFPTGANTFATPSYADERIDIFINGILKLKGIDYNVNSTLGASIFEWISTTPIQGTDNITVIIF